ncbi:GNAT family N-acetyltransferase [Paenibacillus sp. MMS18-CY102]|uniref:GNAT family N-acetyltransferase n=1 Tax=Paenibacillus sp. MMS18-CY102 TaxID=2682849 RepID=UPI0013666862|nr:GNAT family N-acetyltransferase [Paenibacillus sp. MMS18-CY102]MWC27625.1 GNAT family N-acetyltransferase [Paenibacillus sp. MMS18-CY102]
MIHVQKAGLEHIAQMCELLTELFRLEKDFTHSNQVDKYKAGLEMIIRHPDMGQLFVLLNGDSVIGMANLLFTISTAEGGRVITLEDYILAASERGKGYGSYFMQELVQYGRDHGFLRMTLLVDIDNEGAQRFYAGEGYQPSNMKCMRLNLDDH